MELVTTRPRSNVHLFGGGGMIKPMVSVNNIKASSPVRMGCFFL